MKFRLFDSERNFAPNMTIWVYELRSDDGYILEQYYFLTQKAAKNFFEHNIPEENDVHASYGGEILWFT